MKTRLLLWSAVFLLGIASAKQIAANNTGLSDPSAEGLAKVLYTNLHNLNEFHLLFGHQNSTVQGIQPQFTDLTGIPGNSDVLTGVNDYPAIYGFDFGDVNFPGISFSQFRQHALNAYAEGGVITFSFHARNPITGNNFYDLSGDPVTSILQNGSAWIVYRGWLNEIANFANSLTVNGRKIPIIFRPLHEGNGNWFWWGSSNSSSTQYRQLWIKTVNHLRSRGARNLIYEYSPSGGVSSSRYPGDSYVDIIAPTVYGNGDFSGTILSVAREAVNFASARGKIAALGEVGPNNGFSDPLARADFFTNVLLNKIKADPIANRIAYVLVWRNANFSHYWLPVPGTSAYPSFSSFYGDKVSLFVSNLPDMYSPATTTINGFPYCSSPAADQAGFGWGFEFGRSCIVVGSPPDPSSGTASNGYPFCTPGAQDWTGNGWGVQNGGSCVVPGSPADPDD